jgi:hypothetical protein
MKLTIDKEADALYLDLDETPAVESEEISPGVILDYNSEGDLSSATPSVSVDRQGDLSTATPPVSVDRYGDLSTATPPVRSARLSVSRLKKACPLECDGNGAQGEVD